MQQFTKKNFHSICDELAAKDKFLQQVLTEYSYPPFWTRPNTFETLVLTILEQQVSLASAYAAYKKLKERLTSITPKKIVQLTDEELRSCYLSRQKIVYVRELANAVLTKRIDLKSFEKKEDHIVRQELIALKGIGNWTIDIYLLHALHRTDIFPIGDLALVNAIRMIKGNALTKDEIVEISNKWKPYRTIATMIFWHYYTKKKNIKLLH
ncbi:MAG: DNA-3-methyladenine glycosylase 2 family protein [Chitinophagaceae bacterium]|nr:MAG: DNA-3-methyladenine glycosylase 2 family protein [Chitinophagaceae bacterium]